MKKEDLKKRWKEAQNIINVARILECFAAGGPVAENLSPFGLHQNRIDLRGLEITPEIRSTCSKIIKCNFEHVDFAYSKFGDAWTENCIFRDVIFDSANMQGFRDLGNQYVNCSFTRTDLSGAGIGHKGSSYNGCVFKNVKLGRTRFIRPEFDNCLFEFKKSNAINFDASSFVSSKFIGQLYRVGFCNGYFLGDGLIKDFGVPRENHMLNVSFAETELIEVHFRGGCDLSTVIMPEKGDYRRYDNFSKRLRTLRSCLDELPEDIREEIDKIFINIHLSAAVNLKQEMYIINCEDLLQEYGDFAGRKMIEIMDDAV